MPWGGTYCILHNQTEAIKSKSSDDQVSSNLISNGQHHHHQNLLMTFRKGYTFFVDMISFLHHGLEESAKLFWIDSGGIIDAHV